MREPITKTDVDAARQRVNSKPRIVQRKSAKDEHIDWDFLQNLREHPLYNRRGRNRTRGAMQIIEENVPLHKGYLIPGQLSVFRYDEPATKELLEWYDKTPCTIFFGYFRTKKGKIRELGFNLHYFPPFTRKKIMERIFLMFKDYFLKNFDKPSKKPLNAISYRRLINSLRAAKLEVGIREYIPGLRTATRVIPTKFLPDACLTEGTFSGATVREIYDYWRNFKR